jgi:hypothetical protein
MRVTLDALTQGVTADHYNITLTRFQRKVCVFLSAVHYV